MLKERESKVFIHPGQLYFSDTECRIHTTLGSCIAITLWHLKRRIGGMCHFVLPKRTCSDNSECPNGRYADEVIELFRRQISARGTHFYEYQAKVFGGSIVRGSHACTTENTVGIRNTQAAVSYLKNLDVEILAMHVGMFGYRRVIFDVGSGEVWVKHENASGTEMKPPQPMQL